MKKLKAKHWQKQKEHGMSQINLTFDEWMAYGLENSFCGPPVCITHDGEPLTDEEIAEIEDGGDPCIHLIRPYHDVAERLMVESAHSPSIWRRPGWE